MALPNLRREALSLYRDVLRTARAFTWDKQPGEPWRGVLEASTRAEFEKNRNVEKSEDILALLVDGRAALIKTEEKFALKAEELAKNKK
eukprot:g6207.t1